MRLTIKDNAESIITMVEVMVIESDGKSNDFRIFCADGDQATVRADSPLAVQNILNNLKLFGNAEMEGNIDWSDEDNTDNC